MKNIFVAIIVATLSMSLFAQKQTWQIGEDMSLEPVTPKQTSFEQDFGRIRRAVDRSERENALIAIWDFQRKYPELTDGSDWDDYIEAELSFADGQWRKSSELFSAFLDNHPISEFYNAALERTYEIASAFLHGQRRRAFWFFRIRAYDDGEIMMRKIADRAGRAPIASRALMTLAQSLEKRQLYLDAYDVWVQVAIRWPTGEIGRLSLAGMARTMHSAFKGANFDASPVISAEGYYGQYMLRYPELAEAQGVEEYLQLAREQIAYKKYTIAKHYEKNRNYDSANIYYNYILELFDDTSVAEMAQQRIEQISQYETLTPIKPEEKNLLWRLLNFFNFNPVEEG